VAFIRVKIGIDSSSSAIADHAVQQNHVISWNNAKVLQKECDSRARHIRESIWIRKSPKNMNRLEGAHYLSHVYDTLLEPCQPCDKAVRKTDQYQPSRKKKKNQYQSSLWW